MGLGHDLVKYELLSISEESGRQCWSASGKILAPQALNLPIVPGASACGQFRVQFITPLRLLAGGVIQRAPRLRDMVDSLSRRIFLLRYFHGDGVKAPPPPQYAQAAAAAVLTERQLRWHDHRRLSTRKRHELPIGGVSGYMVFRGDFGLLEPLLRLGEYAHLGKNAIFGLGRIALTTEREGEGMNRR
jgi:CRISPR/Cas system endoribonuclease Cas6 (RAMP superfamily)